MQLAVDVISKVPESIDYETTYKNIGENKNPLDVVLLQEIQRYNRLLYKIKYSLLDLQKGIQGFVLMSAELEEIFTCIYEGRVPSLWLKGKKEKKVIRTYLSRMVPSTLSLSLSAYPSLKRLGSWTMDLVSRVAHFHSWANTTHPPVQFWLAAFTFPTGFLTAVLQTSARRQEISIDTLSWEFETIPYEAAEKPPVE